MDRIILLDIPMLASQTKMTADIFTKALPKQAHELHMKSLELYRCPPQCCSRCRDEAQEERIAQKAEIQQMEAVPNGPVPELHTESEEEEPEEAEELIEPGDRIFQLS